MMGLRQVTQKRKITDSDKHLFGDQRPSSPMYLCGKVKVPAHTGKRDDAAYRCRHSCRFRNLNDTFTLARYVLT